jgi:hypothetical protein
MTFSLMKRFQKWIREAALGGALRHSIEKNEKAAAQLDVAVRKVLKK